MYSNTCDICGAYLDPGEKCDCTRKKTVVDIIRDDYRPSDKPTREEAMWLALGIVRK